MGENVIFEDIRFFTILKSMPSERIWRDRCLSLRGDCMKKACIFKQKKFLMVFTVLFFLYGICAFPWWTQHHPVLSYLSQSHFINAMGSANLASYFSSFCNAAIDPDEHRTLSHGDARTRAQNAFNAAVNAYHQGLQFNDYAKFEEAALHLGHSFHYLQDLGDPTKVLDDMFHDQRGQDTRGIADRMFSGMGSNWNLWLEQESRAVAYSDMAGVLDRLYNLRVQQGQRMRDLFENYRAFGNFNLEESLKMELDLTFAAIVACQNRVIDLFAQQIQERGPVPPVKSQNYIVMRFSLKGYGFVHYCEIGRNSNGSEEYCLGLIRSVGYNYLQRRRIYFSSSEITDLTWLVFQNRTDAAMEHCNQERLGLIPWLASSCR